MSLVPWAIKNNISYAKIKPSVLPGSGKCLIATAEIQPGECVCEVPVSAAIRVFPGCALVLQLPPDRWMQLPWFAQLALTLLSERAKGGASKWADYLQQLPAAVGVPVLWSEADLQQLQCAYFIEQVQQQRAEWASLSASLEPYLAAAGISTEQLLWALSVTRSRTFAAPYAASTVFGMQLGWLGKSAGGQQQAQQHVLAPFLDLFNHRGDVESECEFVSGLRSQAFRVVASQPWARGQEVFINYGSSSNDALMQLYGFVQEDNPDDRYIVRTLPGALSKLGLAGDSTSSDTNTLAEVVFTRQGLDAAAAAQLLTLIPGDAAVLPDASGSVPFAVLSSGAKAVCAGAVEQELSALAVDADRDAEVLQAFEQLPAKHAELASKQADLAQANSRLDQLQQMLQAPQDSEQLEAEEQQQQVAELVATRQLCEDVCQRVSAEVSGLEAVTARWQQLVEQHKQVAVLFRLQKSQLLEHVLCQLR